MLKELMDLIDKRILKLSNFTCPICKGSGYKKLPDKNGKYGVSCSSCCNTREISFREKDDRKSRIDELRKIKSELIELVKKDLEEFRLELEEYKQTHKGYSHMITPLGYVILKDLEDAVGSFSDRKSEVIE